MKIKSAYFVGAIGTVFIIASVLRFFGNSVPSLVIALISVVAALITLSDVLEITKFRKYCFSVQLLALSVFILAFILWLFPIDSNISYISNISDGFTIMGLGFVIGLYGLKEIFEHNRGKNPKTVNEVNYEYLFRITKNEYDEVMKINDVIMRLKKLDQETFPINRLHDGWAQFSDILYEHMQMGKVEEQFYDGKNREKFTQFIIHLDKAAEKISNIADSDYLTLKTKKVDVGLDIDEVSIQPRINNMHINSIKEVYKGLEEALNSWDEFKDSVNKRYEKERAELRK